MPAPDRIAAPAGWGTQAAVFAAAAVVGGLTWWATAASRTPEAGISPWLWVVLGVAAAIGGVVAPRAPVAVGLGLGVPAIVACPFTTPHRPGDGTWVLVGPLLFFVTVALVGVAFAAGAARHRLGAARG